jgi:hypothetical protein
MAVSDFNSTLFDLTDEMMAIINPPAVMGTAYTVFKNMYAANPENDMAVKAFWEVAKENKEMIAKHDVSAMADVLRSLIPMPGMVDDVMKALSDENRDIVADYVSVLYEQAAAIQANLPDVEDKETRTATSMYSMYNEIWRDFLLLLESNCEEGDRKRRIVAAREKLQSVLDAKGADTEMVFAVLHASMKAVLPKQAISPNADILRLCLPPSDVAGTIKKNAKLLKKVIFPFNRDLPFSDLLETALDALKSKSKDGEKLGAFWHYIKLFTVCVHECPPEIQGMMNNMVSFFNQESSADFLLRAAPAVLTK